MGRSRKAFFCLDCKQDTGKIGEYYMLKDHVWKVVRTSREGMYCIGCFEARLGRELCREDFVDCELNNLNNSFFKNRSSRLVSRLKKNKD